MDLTDFFGSQILEERNKQELSLFDLSKKTTISEDDLLKIESGEKIPDIRQLMLISQALGKQQGHFFSKIFFKK